MADPSYLHRRRSPSPPRGPASHRNRDPPFNRFRETTRRATLPSQGRSPESSFTRGREPLRRAETLRDSRSQRSQSPLPRFPEISRPQRENGPVRPEPERTVSLSAVETQHGAKSTASATSVSTWRPPSDNNGGPSGSNTSAGPAFETFFNALADACHWYSEHYNLSKQCQHRRAELEHCPAERLEYASRHIELQNKLKKSVGQWRTADDRLKKAKPMAKESFVKFMATEEMRPKLISSGTAIPTTDSPNAGNQIQNIALENRLSALENGYKTEIEEQSRRIAFLEAKVQLATRPDDPQTQKIEKLEDTVATLTEQLEKTKQSMSELEAKYRRQETAIANIPHIADAPAFVDMQALVKEHGRQLTGLNAEARNLGKEVAEIRNSKGPVSVPQKPSITKADLREFATKADIRECATQYDLQALVNKTEFTTAATKADLAPFALQSDLQTHAEHCKQQYTEADESLKSVRNSVQEIFADGKAFQASVADLRNTMAFYEDANLLARISSLEKATINKEALDGIDLERLRIIAKGNFADDIAEAVSKKVSASPQPQPTSTQSPSPSVPNFDFEQKVSEIKKAVDARMKVISLKVGQIIDGEAKDRDKLAAKLDYTVKDLQTLVARVAVIESTASALTMADLTALTTRVAVMEERGVPVTQSEVADLRANIAALQANTTTEIEKVNATVQGIQNSLSQSIPTIFTDAETFRASLGALQGQMNGIRQHSSDQYQQLCHSQRVLQSWQDQFSTKAIYRDIVAQIQQLVPSGTLVRLTNMEVRIEKIESAASYDRVQGLDSRLATVEQAVLRSGSPLANGTASG